MQSSKKKYVLNILIILAITIIAMYFSLKDNFAAIVDAIQGMSFGSVLLIICWGLLINGVVGVAYYLLGKQYKKGYSLLGGIVVAFVGTFFAGVTPSSTGGQFGQVYVLKKQGISYSDGLSLLWADFIIYQTTMMIYVTILFMLRFTHYVDLNAWVWLVAAGYLVNVVVILALYTMALCPKLYVWLSEKLVKILGKLHIVADPERQASVWSENVRGFTREIKKLSHNWKLILQVSLVNVVRLTLYFSLPFVVSKALGIALPWGDLIDTIALSSFVIMANAFIPLPGASGGTEVFFAMLFTAMLGPLTGAVLLLWRLSSYYLPVMAGALVFIMFKNNEDRKKKKMQQEAV